LDERELTAPAAAQPDCELAIETSKPDDNPFAESLAGQVFEPVPMRQAPIDALAE
jgi:hypothetical protein